MVCDGDGGGDGGNGSGDCGDGAGDDGGKATATAAMAKAAMAKATMASRCGFLGLLNNGMFHFWVICWSTTLLRNGNTTARNLAAAATAIEGFATRQTVSAKVAKVCGRPYSIDITCAAYVLQRWQRQRHCGDSTGDDGGNSNGDRGDGDGQRRQRWRRRKQ